MMDRRIVEDNDRRLGYTERKPVEMLRDKRTGDRVRRGLHEAMVIT